LQVELEVAALAVGDRFGRRGLGFLEERRWSILRNRRENGRLGAIPGGRFGGGGGGAGCFRSGGHDREVEVWERGRTGEVPCVEAFFVPSRLRAGPLGGCNLRLRMAVSCGTPAVPVRPNLAPRERVPRRSSAEASTAALLRGKIAPPRGRNKLHPTLQVRPDKRAVEAWIARSWKPGQFFHVSLRAHPSR
jgi:hypothetical protein